MGFSLGTFSHGEAAPYPGMVIDGRVIALGELAPLLRCLDLPRLDSLLDLVQHWQRGLPCLLELAQELPKLPEGRKLAEVRVHAPIMFPRQIFCAIGNYRSYVADVVRDPSASPRLGALESPQCLEQAARIIEERLRNPPYVCLKLPSTVIGPSDSLEIPADAARVDWELELGVIIGRRVRRVTRQQAMQSIAGYTLVNDITIRERVARPDLPRLGSDWLQAKSSPGFLPMGPSLIPAEFVPDPYALRLTLRLNGETMQSELVADMLFDIASQIEYISQHAQLLPGDVICTGTPAGCGIRYQRFLRPGDLMEASAPGFGMQRTRCIAETAAAGIDAAFTGATGD